MKKVIFYFLLLIGSVCTFTACDNDDDDGNNGNTGAGSVMFGNENYQFFVGWYDYEYGDGDDVVPIDLYFDLLTEEKAATLDLDGLDPYDDDVLEDLDPYLTELNFLLTYKDLKTTLPKAGTYTVDIDSYKDMTISRGYFGDDDIASGSCKISISGNIYTIEIDFVCENNKSLKGTYKGVLRDYDE